MVLICEYRTYTIYAIATTLHKTSCSQCGGRNLTNRGEHGIKRIMTRNSMQRYML